MVRYVVAIALGATFYLAGLQMMNPGLVLVGLAILAGSMLWWFVALRGQWREHLDRFENAFDAVGLELDRALGRAGLQGKFNKWSQVAQRARWPKGLRRFGRRRIGQWQPSTAEGRDVEKLAVACYGEVTDLRGTSFNAARRTMKGVLDTFGRLLWWYPMRKFVTVQVLPLHWDKIKMLAYLDIALNRRTGDALPEGADTEDWIQLGDWSSGKLET